MSDRTTDEGPPADPGWAALIRGAPLGVLILCALLFLLGAGLVLGGFFLAIARENPGWVPWTMSLAIGPTALYLALHLLRRTPWAWSATVGLLGLLLASSAIRAVSSPGLAPAAELAVEAALLLYLARRPVRQAFGRAGRAAR
jgi:hypothetical protein